MKNLRMIFLNPTTFMLVLLLAATGAIMTACSTGSYGRLDFKLAVNDIFESGQVLDNYNYYYIGPDAEPVAIMAIDKKYQLTPSLWKEINLTSEQLKAWMSRIDNRYRLRNRYDGAFIIDQEGNQVGMWYSPLGWTTIQRGEENQLTIYTPDTTKNMDHAGRGVILGSGSN
ncbi:MAG: hypothetical protein KKC76_00490 [Proteobacteria bacterium]|nr:hypothetical protein [Pseudomonadota bacterium]MBU4297011.1 hypothetical protein [Pseudomonadota bacterium]MCG2749892.1 hypothetical protein [Desulfobulbaceae bacterium]